MCLDRVLSKKKSDEIIQQAKKRGYIKVWKVCHRDWHDYRRKTGGVFGVRYKQGIRKANTAYYFSKENAGWYAFLSYEAAKKYGFVNDPIKVCYAKPQWIKRLGGYSGIGRAGIFTHLAFPDWNKGSMTIAEFKKMCKDYRGK